MITANLNYLMAVETIARNVVLWSEKFNEKDAEWMNTPSNDTPECNELNARLHKEVTALRALRDNAIADLTKQIKAAP